MDDLSQFKQTYFEESAELLEVAESGLLRLSPDNQDMDEINAVFRAVHSIKGGGGAFGFTDLVAFAHEFETVMDGVRSSTIPVTTDLVDTLIIANDVLGRLIGHAQENTPIPPGTTDAAAQALCRFLGKTGAPTKSTDSASAEATSATATATVAGAGAGAIPAADDGRKTWCIRFTPKQDLLLSGNDPSFMLRALERMGEATIDCDVSDLPSLDHMEPENLYLKWTVQLLTDQTKAQIEDPFEFVAEEGVVEITCLSETAAGPTAAKTETASVGAVAVSGSRPEADSGAASGSGQLTVYSKSGEAGAKTAANKGAGGAPPTQVAGHTIRVDLDKIDRLVNMVGEMVITQAMVAEHLRDLPPGEFQELLEGLEQLAQHTRELRESVMSIRAQPVGSVFSRMPRLVRDLAAETGKDVVLETSGENTEVDKTVIENLVDPLTHMIRNSIDHGLETPDAREAAGKPRTGIVHLSAQHRSGRIVIEVSDDGRGINRPRVLEKAVEQGLVPAGASLSDEDIDNLIFLPGFSTADKVSNISGRGVGMDVVRRNISGLGGRIAVYSAPGQGSRFVLSLPLTLAVLDGMVISVGAERFVLPLTNIVESLRPKHADLHGLVNKCDVMMARGEYVRLVYLHKLFGIPGAVEDASKGLVVLVESEGDGRLGLVVDEVLGQQQVVIKSLEANFRRLDGVGAATILGDGRVALILDVAGLQEMSQHSGSGGGVRQISDLASPAAVPLLRAS
ncbi:Chemotaxis protein CheA [uncultured Gammaproteobacteria bacterium]